MEKVRNEWLDLIFSCSKKIDKEVASEGIKWLYQSSGLKEPEILFVSSPLGIQYACNMLGDNVGANVWTNVYANVWTNVGANVYANVRANVYANVGANVGANVRANVGANVRANVRANRLKYFDFASYGNVSDFGWLAFYDFFDRIGLEYNNEGFTKLKNLMKSGVYDMVQLDGLCVVCELPNIVNRAIDETTGIGRLHSIKEPAISWSDGYELHYLWGVYFEKDLWEQVVSGSMSAKDILKLENMEQRMCALKVYDQEKLFREIDAKLLDTHIRDTLTHDGIKTIKYELFEVDKVFSTTEYFVNYKCPSTGRFYSSCVEYDELEEKTAEGAMAWKQGRTVEEYRLLEVEA